MRKPSKKPPSPKPAKRRALLVFGTMAGGTAERAGRFGPEAAEMAARAASSYDMKWLPLTAPERHDAVKELPEGVMNSRGHFSVPLAPPGVVERLEKIEGVQCRPKPVAPAKPTDPAGDPSPVALGAPSTAETTEMAAGAQPALEPQPLPSPALPNPTAGWDDLKLGQIVLGADEGERGRYEGFWEATVVGISGDQVKLRWLGSPASEPPTTHERKYLALIHPAYAKEL
jgi:hypothetical protein